MGSFFKVSNLAKQGQIKRRIRMTLKISFPMDEYRSVIKNHKNICVIIVVKKITIIGNNHFIRIFIDYMALIVYI